MGEAERLGATVLADGRCRFVVWAPLATTVEARLLTPTDRCVPLTRGPGGYFRGVVDGVPPGARYRYCLDGAKERPDPASRWQPEGVHGPSAVVDPAAFAWRDHLWSGRPLAEYIFYELHVGTFTPEGTFDAVIPRLEALAELGITAIELMPVAPFPGERNWGYDGVQPFAVQQSYGGPDGLRRLVDACHARGLAVVLDVVYNHLGPEGNYLGDYGPYFTDAYRTPWGDAINFDGPDSDEVRRYVIECALAWLTDYHVDALRLDAVHAIKDFSARPFLAELATAAHDLAGRLNRRCHLIAESDLNDARLIRPPASGGFGLDAQWSDDFHHALHVTLTGERDGYYGDFRGVADLTAAFRQGFVYTGQRSAFRRRRHGGPPNGVAAEQFVVSSQNHDQVGNRMLGERLGQLVSFERLKLAAAAVMLSPFLPLLFMGEEYGETAPFLYFTDHGDPALIEAVRAGRRAEFAAFAWRGEAPDPQAESTFRRSILNHALRERQPHRPLWEWYRELIGLRRTLAPIARPGWDATVALTDEPAPVLTVRRWSGREHAVALFNFGDDAATVSVLLVGGPWRTRLDSAAARWAGPGSAVPDALDGDGPTALTLPPTTVVVLARAAEERR
jgi:maltooligosyltrehalose trehalohydrolase